MSLTTVAGLERHPMLQGGRLDTSEQLAPCPFCGRAAGFRTDVSSVTWVRAECSNTSCAVRTPFHYRTREGAAAAWNRREPPWSPPAP